MSEDHIENKLVREATLHELIAEINSRCLVAVVGVCPKIGFFRRPFGEFDAETLGGLFVDNHELRASPELKEIKAFEIYEKLEACLDELYGIEEALPSEDAEDEDLESC